MTQKQKLLTYNSEKAPLVEKFFNSMGHGMQSHYMREAIEFYMKYKDIIQENTLNRHLELHVNPEQTSRVEHPDQEEKVNKQQHSEFTEASDDDYDDIDPNNF